jgi:uncharacterized membrane protein
MITDNVTIGRYNLLLLALILAAGAVLRFYHIDANSLWFDELHSIVPTNPLNTLSFVVEYARTDQPPFFFILLALWFKIFPYTEVSGRILCAIIGVLGILAMYFLGKEVEGKKTGLVSAAATAFNVFHLYYSQELRFYSLLFLLSTLSFLFFVRFIRNPSVAAQLLFTLSAILILYTHYFGMVVVATQALLFVLVVLKFKKDFKFFLKGLACGIMALVAFSPWLKTVFADNRVAEFWIDDPGALFFLAYFERYFNGWWPVSYKPVFTILLFILALSYLFSIRKKELYQTQTTINYWVIIGWILLTLGIPYLYTIFKIPMIIDRYTIITLPAIIFIVSSGFLRLSYRYIQILVVVLFLIFSFRTHYKYFTKYKKQEMRELTHQVIIENPEHFPVFSRWAWHLNYYFDKYRAGQSIHLLEEADLVTFTESVDGFWVIFPHHLNQRQMDIINVEFESSRELLYYQAQAKLFKRKSSR